jgi:hypothetical protein
MSWAMNMEKLWAMSYELWTGYELWSYELWAMSYVSYELWAMSYMVYVWAMSYELWDMVWAEAMSYELWAMSYVGYEPWGYSGYELWNKKLNHQVFCFGFFYLPYTLSCVISLKVYHV